MSNISGIFTINLLGQERQLKATFEAIETIEQRAKPVMKLLKEALEGEPSFSDIVTVFQCGLAARSDTRLSRNEIGNAILEEGGLDAVANTYLEFLTHCITGGRKAKENPLDQSL